MNAIQTLLDFISAAERSRKYLPKMAANRKTPLRVIEPILTEDEKTSITVLKDNIDNIFQALFAKNPSKMSATSMNIYKSSVKKLIDDYENYGIDQKKMASWQPNFTPKRTSQAQRRPNVNRIPETFVSEQESSSDLIRSEIPLGGNRKVIILGPDPTTLSDDEFNTILDVYSVISGKRKKMEESRSGQSQQSDKLPG